MNKAGPNSEKYLQWYEFQVDLLYGGNLQMSADIYLIIRREKYGDQLSFEWDKSLDDEKDNTRWKRNKWKLYGMGVGGHGLNYKH